MDGMYDDMYKLWSTCPDSVWKIIFSLLISSNGSSINLCDIFVKQKLWIGGLDQYWQFLFVCQYY